MDIGSRIEVKVTRGVLLQGCSWRRRVLDECYFILISLYLSYSQFLAYILADSGASSKNVSWGSG